MSHRIAQLLLLGVLLAFVSPVLLGGRILLDHDLGRELGAYDQPGERRRVDRLSEDQTSTYLPELQVHLTGERSGWLVTFNPHVELGRPTGHLSGFSRVFLPTHALAFLTSDALVAYSWLAVLATVLSAVFGYGLLRSLALAPAPCLFGALGFAFNVWAVNRLNAVMFPWGVCWTLAILWGTVRTVERITWPRLLGLAFAVHALVLTAYPQQVVWHAYFLIGFALVRVARRPGGLAACARALGALALAALAGAATTLPVVLDVVLAVQRSGRGAVDPEFFIDGVRGVGSVADAAHLVLDRFDPFWFGDPSRPGFPLAFHGGCTGALGVLVPLSLIDGLWRRLWGWQLLVLFALIVSVSPALYRFGVEHLGLGLSRFGPPGGVVIPAVLLAASAADHVLGAGVARRALAAGLVLALPLATAVATLWVEPSPRLVPTAIGVALCLGVVVFVWTRSPWLLAALAVAATLHYGFRLLPFRERERTPVTSPLIEAVRERTRDGRRFAWVGRGSRGTLPANLEALVGLSSVHAYDPLAWAGYGAWVLGLSRGGLAVSPPGGGEQSVASSADTYGRHFRRILTDDLHAAELARAGVSTLLSTAQLDPNVATWVGNEAGVGVFKTVEQPVLEAQLAVWHEVGPGAVALAGPLRDGSGRADGSGALAARRVLDRGDRLRLRVTPSPQPTLLFVSRQYHPQWHARTLAGVELPTVSVDGFYLGVVLRQRTELVALEFRPHARWMWLVQLGFLAAGALGVVSSVRRRQSA